MFRAVLVGLDHSPAAQRALAEAIELAERHGGRLTILTAVPQPRGWPGGPVESITAARELAAQLERDAIALQRAAVRSVPAGVPVATLIRHTTASAALLEQLTRGCHDTLVIGAPAGRSRWVLGRRLTRRVLTRSPVPVLVVDADGAVWLSPAGPGAASRYRWASRTARRRPRRSRAAGSRP